MHIPAITGRSAIGEWDGTHQGSNCAPFPDPAVEGEDEFVAQAESGCISEGGNEQARVQKNRWHALYVEWH